MSETLKTEIRVETTMNNTTQSQASEPVKTDPERAEQRTPPGYVLAPGYRGYAHLGTGQYLINHTDELPAELVISVATEAEKAGRTVGDEMDNGTCGNPIQPEDMCVRLRFENVSGLDALERRLRYVRATHFAAPPAPQAEQREQMREPLFLLHCGKIDSGGEQDEWEIEAYSGQAVDAFALLHPGQTIGLFPQAEQREPLTEAQLMWALRTSSPVQPVLRLAPGWRNFAREIERMHGIGAPKTEEAK